MDVNRNDDTIVFDFPITTYFVSIAFILFEIAFFQFNVF